MSYEVTAIKKRPESFTSLAGQDFVVSTLQNAVSSGQIAHAYLFSGPRGVGKTSSARILAKALNCEQGPSGNPCGECSQCKEIKQGNSLDVIEIDGASNTSVNDVRVIRDEVLFPPNNGKYKIYIIDEVHMLSGSAFNALLKTIEEPPPYVIFIFATTELHKVPATIRSRCQQFRFRLIGLETIVEHLKSAAGELSVNYEAEAMHWIAKEAGGSMRDAYTLFDQVVSFSQGNITLEIIQEKLGLVGIDAVQSLLNACASGHEADAQEQFSQLVHSGHSVEQIHNDCTDYIRALLLYAQGIRREGILGFSIDRMNSDILKTWKNYQLEQALQLLFEFYRNSRYSLNTQYEFELILAKLSRLSDLVSVKSLVDRIQGLSQGNVQQHQATAPEPVSEDPQREAILEQIRNQFPALTSSMEQAKDWQLLGGVLKLQVPSEFHANKINDFSRVIQDTAGEILQRKIHLEIEIHKTGQADQGGESNPEMAARIFKGSVLGGENS
jgi:DNA polymerase-3 subunit gamma/tau